jgi:hypothetical protein
MGHSGLIREFGESRAGGPSSGVLCSAAAPLLVSLPPISPDSRLSPLRLVRRNQDEQQEYAGRLCDYLGGTRVEIRDLHAAEAFDFLGAENPDVVVWDLHESDESERGAIFAELKAKLCAINSQDASGARRWWSTRRSR